MRFDVDTGKVLLCGAGSARGDCGIKVSKKRFGPGVGLGHQVTDKWVVRAGYGLTNDPYEALELVRANYPILIQVRLESPDGLHPIRTLAQGIATIKVPGRGNGIIDINAGQIIGAGEAGTPTAPSAR